MPVSRESIFSIFIKFCEVISVHFYVRWYFSLKGQCHEIVCFRFFSWILFFQAPEIRLRSFQICSKNSGQRYSEIKVHHCYQWHWRKFAARVNFATGINNTVGKLGEVGGSQNLSHLWQADMKFANSHISEICRFAFALCWRVCGFANFKKTFGRPSL